MMVCLNCCAPEAASAAPIYASRAEVPAEARWRLEDIYETVELWEQDAREADALAERLSARRGRVMDSPQSLLETLKLEEQLGLILGKLYCYAAMRSHEDTAAEEPKARASRAVQLSVRCSEASSFVTPEILAGAEKLGDFMAACDELKLYELMFSRIVRQKAHILPAEQEALLAAMGELAGSPDDVFSMLTDADMNFGEIEDEDGTKQPLTQESYGRYMTSSVRRVRQAAFEGIHRRFGEFRNTLGACYSASVKKDVTFARLRHYESSLEASLYGDEIPVSVYDGLVTAVNANLDALHAYVQLKKEALGVETMQPWDLYAPFTAEPQKVYTYEDAQKLVLEAVAPLGAEYQSVMKRAFSEGWIDVYENKGKRSGAYSWGTYGVHPYMLLNYGGTYRDVSTLAHEGGHSMHSWYSNQNQPSVYADYSLFVAEVASTVNEMLLVEHLLKNSTDTREKIALLNQQLELIRQTIYRQTLFAEFERDTHACAERGEPLTPEKMNAMWTELNTRYYGEEVGSNPHLAAEWSRIPHFYRAFYVYQYATSLSAAVALADGILTGGEAERDAYLSLLKSGCSKDPISLLRDAGVDMSTPAPVERALAVFARKTEELKGLLGQTF